MCNWGEKRNKQIINQTEVVKWKVLKKSQIDKSDTSRKTIHMHIHIYTDAHMHKNTCIHTQTYVDMHSQNHTHIRTDAQMHKRTHIHTPMYSLSLSLSHTHTNKNCIIFTSPVAREFFITKNYLRIFNNRRISAKYWRKHISVNMLSHPDVFVQAELNWGRLDLASVVWDLRKPLIRGETAQSYSQVQVPSNQFNSPWTEDNKVKHQGKLDSTQQD